MEGEGGKRAEAGVLSGQRACEGCLGCKGLASGLSLCCPWLPTARATWQHGSAWLTFGLSSGCRLPLGSPGRPPPPAMQSAWFG